MFCVRLKGTINKTQEASGTVKTQVTYATFKMVERSLTM